jgi:hypothetical protein
MNLEEISKMKEYFQIGSNHIKKILKMSFIPFFAKLITKQIKNKSRGIHIANTNSTKEDSKEKEENEEEKEDKQADDASEKSGDESEKEENEDDQLYANNSDNEEVEEENNETGEEEIENAEDVTMKEETTTPKKEKEEDYSYKSRGYTWDEGKVDYMKFDKNQSIFSFELYLPYTQKNLLLKNIMDMALKNIIFKSVTGVKSCRVHENLKV